MAKTTRRKRPTRKRLPSEPARNGTPPSPVIIEDTTLRYQLKGSKDVIELAPLRVKIESGPLERKHKLQTTELGEITPTWAFAEELALILGVPVSVAMQAWIDSSYWWADQQKKTL